jgi:hypothetical protein
MSRRRQNGSDNLDNVEEIGEREQPASNQGNPSNGNGHSNESACLRMRKREERGTDWIESLLKIEERRLGQESARLKLETDKLQLERDKFT